MRSVELFVGAGGLAMGVSRAGFSPEAVVEWNHDACDTIRENQRLGVEPVKHWPLHEMDVRDFDYTGIKKSVDLLAGGPPCQPFSLGGKHRGHRDVRDMFPQVVRAVRELQPRAILVENVKGLTRSAFARYFEYIRLQITYPDVIKKKNEEWLDHLGRLERYHTKGKRDGLYYRVVTRVLNAADYGVPQRRERVFFVGFRSDLGLEWSFPRPTHSMDALLWDQWVSGVYWDVHRVAKKRRPDLALRMQSRVERLRAFGEKPKEKPWRTVRDAISDLPMRGGGKIRNHIFVPGARAYPGHTGSPLDEPAKTIKAGDHGVPGGENMLASPDGSVRYFSVRESARLQSFPDDYVFHGSWTESMRQLGNAVPVELGHAVAGGIRTLLDSGSRN
ncbi:DNA cytosine methyltransferase [Patescibacteria group bacterium]|nr:DNA cytosine methyltransferase [Patescibacteria group bacterium]